MTEVRRFESRGRRRAGAARRGLQRRHRDRAPLGFRGLGV